MGVAGEPNEVGAAGELVGASTACGPVEAGMAGATGKPSAAGEKAVGASVAGELAETSTVEANAVGATSEPAAAAG